MARKRSKTKTTRKNTRAIQKGERSNKRGLSRTPRLLIATAFATVCTFLPEALPSDHLYFVLAFRVTFALALLAFFFSLCSHP
jgi:uncharacterized membrane protein